MRYFEGHDGKCQTPEGTLIACGGVRKVSSIYIDLTAIKAYRLAFSMWSALINIETVGIAGEVLRKTVIAP